MSADVPDRWPGILEVVEVGRQSEHILKHLFRMLWMQAMGHECELFALGVDPDTAMIESAHEALFSLETPITLKIHSDMSAWLQLARVPTDGLQFDPIPLAYDARRSLLSRLTYQQFQGLVMKSLYSEQLSLEQRLDALHHMGRQKYEQERQEFLDQLRALDIPIIDPEFGGKSLSFDDEVAAMRANLHLYTLAIAKCTTGQCLINFEADEPGQYEILQSSFFKH